MAQELTLRQRIGVKIKELQDIRQRMSQLAVTLENTEIEYMNRRNELKSLINELYPELAVELFNR